jgi:hypothetical protein
MIIRYHSLETYYLNRRLELLQRLDDYAEQTLHDEDFEMNDLNPVIKMLRREYADVIDPENLCQTLKKIYPDELFGIESRKRSYN